MYKVLAVYARGYNKDYPVVCLDEKSKQLIEDVREPIPLKPGSPVKYDGEYRRKGTRNIFVAVEPLAGRRKVLVTKRRQKSDFANFVRKLVDGYYRKAKKVILVLDNLNIHFAASFQETFTRGEAKRILKKIQFCYTPKHGSWLNMAEIEINILSRECLSRRIGDSTILENEIDAWAEKRNNIKAKITWSFTRKNADLKLSKYYVA
jgi:hypothetical protein